MRMHIFGVGVLAVGFWSLPQSAMAQSEKQGSLRVAQEHQEAEVDPEEVMIAQVEPESRPAPPQPGDMETEGIQQRAGLGGDVAFATGGVLELGGSLGITTATNLTSITIAPTIGWFFIDNFQISGIFGLNIASGDGRTQTFGQVLAEPSFHYPFTDALFGFVGVGAGLSWLEGAGVGFAVAPRLGAKVMVGRSGVLTPAVTLLYSTNDVVQTEAGQLVSADTRFGLNIGYTVMW